MSFKDAERRGRERARAELGELVDRESVSISVPRYGQDRESFDWHLHCQRPVDCCECIKPEDL